MQDGNNRKNNAIDNIDNPYINDKIYPVTIMITCSFLDANAAYKYNLRLYHRDKFDDIDEETMFHTIDKELEGLGNTAKDVIIPLNSNNMEALHALYDMINDKFNKEHPEPNNFNDIKIESLDEVKNRFKKAMYIEMLEDHILEPIKEKIKAFNTWNFNKYIELFIDSSDLVCLSKKFGCMHRLDSPLYPYEFESLSNQANKIISTMKDNLKSDSDIIMVEYISLFVNLKNTPFALLITDKRKRNIFYTDGVYDIYNAF